MSTLERLAARTAAALNRVNTFVVGVLMLLLLLNVWAGVLDRYLLHWQITWVEELARYLMIWGILLAVPVCSFGREHICLEIVQRALPPSLHRLCLLAANLLALLFFAYVAFLGADFVSKGLGQVSGVFGVSMALPYAAVPAAFGLAALQELLVLLRDLRRPPAALETGPAGPDPGQGATAGGL